MGVIPYLSVTQISAKGASQACSPGKQSGITSNKIILYGTFMSKIDIGKIKIPYSQFHVTQMAEISAKVLTDLKLKQTTKQTIKTNKRNPKALHLVSISPSLAVM